MHAGGTTGPVEHPWPEDQESFEDRVGFSVAGGYEEKPAEPGGHVARGVMLRGVWAARPDDTVRELVRKLDEDPRYEALPVIDERRTFAGLVDVQRLRASAELPARRVRAAEIMRTDVPGVDPETPVEALRERMRALDTDHLAVVDGEGRVLGIVSRSAIR